MAGKAPTQSAMILLLQRDVEQIGADVTELKAAFREHIAEIKTSLTTQFIPSHEMALITLRFAGLQSAIGDLTLVFQQFRTNSVTHDQFWPVKMLVYGVLGLLGTGIGGLLAFKLKGG